MVTEIIKSIYKLDEEELTQLVYAIKDRRDVLRQKSLNGFRVGNKVTWTDGRGQYKETYEGEVEKINRKSVSIKEKGRSWMKWRISPSLLTIIKGDES